jgi:deoxyribodipyrimidine photo-lyase
VLPIFVVEQRLLDAAGPWRRAQLLASVAALDTSIRSRGGMLTIVHGPAEAAIARLAQEQRVTAVYWNRDISTWAVGRDAAVRTGLERARIDAHDGWNAYVHDPNSIHTQTGGVPRIFTRFYQRWVALPVPPTASGGAARILAVEVDQVPGLERQPFVPAGAACAATACLRR